MEYLETGKNDLLTWCKENGEYGKILIEEWLDDENIGQVSSLYLPFEMEDVMYNTTKFNAHWKCIQCGEKFIMSPRKRTVEKKGCQKCSKKKAALKKHEDALKENDFVSWCKENGEYGKLLLEEWDTEKNREELGIEITDVTAGTGKEVYWKCIRCGESYLKSVFRRTDLKIGCKNCRRHGTSFPEKLIYTALKQIYPDTKNRVKLFENIEYDIYIPSKRFCVEYSGGYWHKNKTERDELKQILCEENNMKFLQIYGYEKEGPLETSEKLIKYGIAYKNHQKQLEEIITFIVELLGHKMQEIDLKKALDETCKLLYRTVENNIAEKYPELVKEWNIEDNNNRKPEHFTTGSRECIQWKCSKCGYKWKVSIKSRIRFKSGCTKCGFNVFDGKIHTRAIRKPKGNFIFGQYNL